MRRCRGCMQTTNACANFSCSRMHAQVPGLHVDEFPALFLYTRGPHGGVSRVEAGESISVLSTAIACARFVELIM